MQGDRAQTIRNRLRADKIINRRSLRAVGRLLSGAPAPDDELIKSVYSKIENGKRLTSLCIFSTDAYEENNKNPFQTVWVKSSNGVYAVVKTVTPILNKESKLYDMKHSFSVVFSTHPHYLASYLLWKKNGLPEVNDQEFNRKVSVICTHIADDIALDNEGGYHFSWALKVMNKHKEDYEDRLLTHGTLAVDKGNIYRSGSSIFYTVSDPYNEDKSNVYFYSNPLKGHKGLDFPDDALDYWLFRKILRTFSIKVTNESVSNDAIHSVIRDTFSYISNHMVRHGDPYDLYLPTTKMGEIGRLSKKIFTRTLQSISHTLFNLNFKSAIMNTVVGAVIVIGLGAVGAFYTAGAVAITAVSAQKTSILMKGFQASLRKFMSFLNVLPTKKPDLYYDYSETHAYTENGNLNTELAIGLPLHPSIAQVMEPININEMGHTFFGAEKYTKESERIWAENLILSTKGYAPGTIFTNNHCLKGNPYLLAEQSNGITVWYDTVERTAYAMLECEPYEHCCLEAPLLHRFNELHENERIVAVRLCKDLGVQSVNLTTIDDSPSEFREPLSRSLHDNEAPMSDRPYSMQLAALNSLPPKTREAVVGKTWTALQRHMRATPLLRLIDIFRDHNKIGDRNFDEYELLSQPGIKRDAPREYVISENKDRMLKPKGVV